MPFVVPSPEQQPSASAVPAQVFGSPDMSKYIQYYNDLVSAAGGTPAWGAGQDLSGISRGGQAPGMFGGVFGAADQPAISEPSEPQFDQSRGVQDMSTPDRFFASLGKIGDAIAGASGFSGWDENANAAENVARFVTSLPTGMASAPFSGSAKMYEMLSGKPVTESDLESNTMAGEDLTGVQRIASGLEGGLDTLGLFLGGSAEALNAGRNVFRAARGADMAPSAIGAASRYLGRGPAAIAVDTAEEAGEEAFQSVMSDVRHDRLDEGSFGRALEGAAYGAAGGAIMSGGGQVLNSALGDSGSTTTVVSEGDRLNPVADRSTFEFMKNLEHESGGPTAASVVSRQREEFSKHREQPTSANQISSTYSNNIGVLEAHVGSDAFMGVMQSSEEGSREGLAQNMDTDVKTLMGIYQMRDEDQQVAALNKLLEEYEAKHGERVKITVGRTPDSNDTGVADFYLTKFVKGNQIGLNKAAYTFYRSDVDGDQMMLYLNPYVTSRGFLTRNFVSKVTGKETFDSDFANFLSNHKNVHLARYVIDEIAPDNKLVSRIADEVEECIRHGDAAGFAGKMAEMVKAVENSRLSAMKDELASRGITEKSEGYDEELGRARASAAKIADESVARYWNTLETTSRATYNTINAAAKKLTVEEKTLYDQLMQTMDMYEGSDVASGTFNGVTLMEIFAELGMQIEATTGLANPFFRQFGEFYYPSKTSYFSNMSNKQLFNAYTKLVAIAFRMGDVAVDVQTAVEGVFRMHVNNMFREKFSKMIVSRDSEGVKEMELAFQEAYNEAIKEFKEAWDGEFYTVGANPEMGAKLPGGPMSDKKPISVGSEEFFVKFNEVMSEQPVGNLVALSESSRLSDTTSWGMALEAAATMPMEGATYFSNMSKEMRAFWSGMLKSYGVKQKRIGGRIEEGCDKLLKITEQLRAYGVFDLANKEGGLDNIPSEHIPVYREWIEGVVRLIGVDNAIRLKMDTLVGILDTTWGKAIVNAVTKEDMYNTVTSARLSAVYHRVFEGLAEMENGDRDRGLMIIQKAVGGTGLANISELHMEIFHEFNSSGTLVTLNEMTNLSVPWSEKVEKFDALFGKDVGSGGLLSAVFKTDDSILSLSSLTQDLALSDRALNKALQKSKGFSKAQAQRIDEQIRNGAWSKKKVVAALRRMGQQNHVMYSSNVMAALVMSGRYVTHEEVEKGMSDLNSMLLFQLQAKAQTGHVMSAIDQMNLAMATMEIDNLVASREAIIRVLVDKNAKIRVFDPQTGEFCELTQEKVFSDYGINDDEYADADDKLWALISEHEPQLLTLFAPQQTFPSYAGADAVLDSGMAKKPFDAIDDMLNPKGGEEQILVDEVEVMAQNFLLDHPSFFKSFILTLSPDVVTSDNSEYVKREVEKHFKRWTENLAWFASLPKSKTLSLASAGYAEKKFDEVFRSVEETLMRVNDVYVKQQMSGMADVIDTYAQESCVKSVLCTSLIKMLNDEGVEVGGVATDNDAIPGTTIRDKMLENIEVLPDIYTVLFQLGDFRSALSYAEHFGEDAAVGLVRAVLESVDMASLNSSQLNGIMRVARKLGATYNANKNGHNPKKWDFTGVTKENISAMMTQGLVGSLTTMSKGGIVLEREKFLSLSPDEAVKAIDRIHNECYGEFTWTDKERGKVRDSFAENETEAMEQYFLTFNNAILHHLLIRATSGSGLTINYDVGFSTVTAIDDQVSLMDEFSTFLSDKKVHLPTNEKSKRPPHVFTYHGDNAVSVATATNVQNRMDSASISTMIGVDASMMKMVAAAAGYGGTVTCGVNPTPIDVSDLDESHINMKYVDPDTGRAIYIENENHLLRLKRGAVKTIEIYRLDRCLCSGACKTCAPKGKNAAARNRDKTSGNVVSTMMNFMMEEMHLKRKKAVGLIRKILFNPQDVVKGIDNVRDYVDRNDPDGNRQTVRATLLDMLVEYRHSVVDSYMRLFSEISGFPLGREDALILANICTPYFEVRMGDGETVVRVNTVDLASNESFSEFEANILAPIGMTSDDISSVVFTNLSINEVSAKNMRGVGESYRTWIMEHPGDDGPTRKDFYRWMDESSRDWRGVGVLDSKQILSRVPEMGMGYDRAAFLDYSPTSVMQWNNDTLRDMANLFDTNGRVAEVSQDGTGGMLTVQDKQNIEDATAIAMRSIRDEKEKTSFNDCAITGVSVDRANSVYRSVFDRMYPSRVMGLADGYPQVSISDERGQAVRDCTDIIASDKVDDVIALAKQSFKNRHGVLVPSALGSRVASELRDGRKYNAHESWRASIGGISFTYIPYSTAVDFDLAGLDVAKSPVSPIDPTRDILWAAYDEGDFGTTDAQLFLHSDTAKNLGYIYTGSTNMPISSLFRGAKYDDPLAETRVMSRADILRGIRSGLFGRGGISIDEIKKSIDLSFYEETFRDFDPDALLENVEEYLKNIEENPDSIVPTANHVSDARNGDCLGFMRRGNAIVPVFYLVSSAPNRADSVSFGIDENNNLVYRIKSKAGISSGSYKFGLYHISFKAMGTIPDQSVLDEWPVFTSSRNGIAMKPDIIANSATMVGRVWGKGKELLSNNLYMYSMQYGANLLYEFGHTGKGREAKLAATLRKDLDKRFYDGAEGESLIHGIMDGDPTVWGEVISGSLKIFDDSIYKNRAANKAISNMAAEIYAHTNNYRMVAAVFNTRYFSPKDSSGYNYKLRTRMIEPKIVFKNMTTKDILAVYNKLDDNFCPPDLMTPAGNRVFDRDGAMLMQKQGRDAAGRFTSEPYRVMVIGGPHYFTDQSGELKDYSRAASYSMQSVIKSMLDVGVFSRDIEELVKYMGAQVGDFSNFYLKDDRDYLKGYEEDDWEKNINQSLLEKVKLNIGNPIFLKKQHEHRKECLALTAELHIPISVTAGANDPTPAFGSGNTKIEKEVDGLLASFNDALGIKDRTQEITLDELLMLARYQVGYSYNSGEIGSITFSQLKNAVNRMIESVKSDDKMIIKAGIYSGSHGDRRVPINLLLPDIAERIWRASSAVQERYTSFEDWKKAQYEVAKDLTMRDISTLRNRAKSIALRKMMDAVAYANGYDQISGHVTEGEYIEYIMEELRNGGERLLGDFDDDIADIIRKYDASKTVSQDVLQRIDNLAEERLRMMFDDDDAWGGVIANHMSAEENYAAKIARNLVTIRQMMGVLYVELPLANGLERKWNQGTMSIATHLGTLGLPLYRNTKNKIDPDLKRNVTHDENVKALWCGLREAQLMGMEKEFIRYVRDAGDIKAAVNKFMEKQGRLESFASMVMNFASAKDFGIEGQIGLFLERFAMRIEDEAPWWGVPIGTGGESVFVTQLKSNPAKLIVGLLNGTADGSNADAVMSRECFNWALRGDMAQKNLFSAIYAEIAKRSAGASLFVTAFGSPYFNYATNRFGRIMQWVLPVSSIHHLLVKHFTQGYGAGWKVPGLGDVTFGQLVLEDTQLTKDMKEAVTLDILHMGPQIVACMLLGMAALEPPEDEDKWGNFKEWTIFGARVDANWWLEDMLGLAIPYAAFGSSIMHGKPRLDLITNGILYYLGNNPVVKVQDAVEALFDPFSELEQAYEQDIEGFKKALGSPPSAEEVFMGRTTSFGLSLVGQFITPGILREIYNQGQDYEASYKRIFQEGQWGEQTAEGEQGDRTQYTTYQDAMLRKYTRNNPVLGFLANQIWHPETGYMAHEMPRNVIYDPFQMNAMEYFSIYNDPFNKKDEKTDEEKDALAVEAIGTMQANSIEELKAQGFALDYDTKVYISKYVWDIIADLNNEYSKFMSSPASDYYYWGSYEEGKAKVNEIKSLHYTLVGEWKSFYSEKVWSKELSLAKYNRRHTTYATDDNGEIYATGTYPQSTIGGVIPWPVTIAPGESPGEYQQNMGAKYDWQTESVVTGKATGERALVPLQENFSDTPDISSWSTDGSETGYSDRAANSGKTSSAKAPGSGSDSDGSNRPGSRYTRRGGGGGRGGGYRRSGGGGRRGGGGGGAAPNIYSHVNAPNISNPDTMRGSRVYDASYDALRPNFETKGSREAYKRSDI